MIKSAMCLSCGTDFQYETSGGRPRRYCNARCKPVTAGRNHQKNCAHCGQLFSYYKRGSRQILFCSRVCSNRHTGPATGLAQSQKITLPCTQCGQPVTGSPAHMTRKEVKFCSRSCYAKYTASGVIVRECLGCGSSFPTRSGRHTWCTSCLEKVQNRDARLVVARDGMTASDFRDAEEYRQIIAGDPCVYCGAATEQVDHIEPIAAGGSDRWDNYAPVCMPCNLSKYTTPLLAFLMRGGLPVNQGTLEERIYARRC